MTEAPKHQATTALDTPPAYLSGLPIIVDMSEMIERSLARTLSATTPEQALADPDSVGLRELSGKVITITGVVGILPSAHAGASHYLVFEAITKPTGEIETLTTGSPYAASRIVKCYKEGWLPRRMRVLELESTSNPGQSSLWVTDAGAVMPESTEEGF